MFPHAQQRLISSFAAALVLALPFVASAQGNKPAAPRTAQAPQPAPAPQAAPAGQPSAAPAPGTNEKLDVTDLERKYWAAKDTDFNVVQNRLYSKAGRFALSANYGTSISETWSDGPTFAGSAAYYFTERLGLELNYSMTDSKDNADTETLRGQLGFPNHNKMKQFYGASLNFVPFYAKMSVMNYAIIYFDMTFALGGGVQTYQQQRDDGNVDQTAPTVTFDVTQHFFLNRYLALRFDYKNRWFNEDIVIYRTASVPAGGNRTVKTDLHNAQFLMFGLTLYY